MAAASTTKFSSEGFDLDAVAADASGGGGDVVYEIGGGVTSIDISDDKKEKEEEETKKKEDDPMEEAEEYKKRGNAAFGERDFDKAYHLYTKAIESTPGTTGRELLDLRQKWSDEQNRQWRAKLDKDEEERREKARKRREKEKEQREQQKKTGQPPPPANKEDDDDDKQKAEKDDPPPAFVPPPHPHGAKLAVYHCNRAAVLLHQLHYDAAVRDCDVALLLDPRYVKALIRRSTAYEHIDSGTGNNVFGDDEEEGGGSSSSKAKKTDLALQDAKRALELDPTNAKIRATVVRLQKIEDARMEKLKEETMGKLKDLGNSILSNFGLSLDNFNAVQDPSTGSYSVNFNQKK